jgi:glycerophosphoryl diester phosphodiesterase
MLTADARPLLLGHRGVRPVRRWDARSLTSQLPAENTLAALDFAIANGCDGFEFDVRFTRDRRAVLCHDPKIDGKEISATNFADLGQGRDSLPCLEDVLECFGDLAYLDIEVKVGGNEEQVVAAVRAKPPSRGYIVSSFVPELLLQLNRLDSSLPLGYLCDRPQCVNLWTKLPITVFLPHHRLVSKGLIEAAHQRGTKLFTWTVNQRRDLVRLANWGVDGLISDDPELLSSTFLDEE